MSNTNFSNPTPTHEDPSPPTMQSPNATASPTGHPGSDPFDYSAPITMPVAAAAQTTQPSTPSLATPAVNTGSDAFANAQTRRDAPTDPRVVALRAMFPDYDDLILQSVLESVGGDQDRAIDALLGMSDPDYRSEAPPAEIPLTQTDLDEQLARRLMLEEQEQQQVAWQAQQEAQQRHLPPRQRADQQQQNPGAQGGDTMAEFQQQFNKIAETGKKTFGTIFSKVKAKIQEFDQPRPGQGSNPGTQPTWEGSGAYESNQHAPQPPYARHPARQESYQTPQQQPAYYDPNAYSAPPRLSASPSPPITLSPAPPAVQGYDVSPDPPAVNRTTSPPATMPSPTPSVPNASTSPLAGTTPRSQAGSGVSQGTPIDGGKFGLLPKKPVSLLRTQSPPPNSSQNQHQPQRRNSDDSDGLEYAENPFEEAKK